MRDLEIALVLAREMKAAAARSVDASLRLDQLQEVFGVEDLDRAERARIQTALQMAGLEPFPSLLDAEPSDPIRFGATKTAAATGAGAAGAAGASAEPPPAPPEEPPAEPAQTFPTVGQFARSKLRRRRFGVRRGDHGNGDAPEAAGEEPAPGAAAEEPPAAAEEPPAPPAAPLPADEPEPLYRHGDALAEAEEEVTRAHQVPAEYADANGHAPEHAEADHGVTEVHYEVEPEEADEAEESVTDVHHEVVEEPESADEGHVDEHDVEPAHEPELEPHAEDEREYIPLARPEPVTAAAPILEEPPPAQAPGGARTAEVVAALLPAVVIPVIVTSIAGWRFGLPFVALSVIATGIVLSRRGDGERHGLFATLRGSAGARTALLTTAIVTVLAVGASIALTAVDDSGSSGDNKTAAPAKKPVPPPQSSASKPATPAPKKKKSPKQKAEKQNPPAATTEPPPATTEPQPTEPQPDPATEGLIRVPPSSAAQPTTTTPQQTP